MGDIRELFIVSDGCFSLKPNVSVLLGGILFVRIKLMIGMNHNDYFAKDMLRSILVISISSTQPDYLIDICVCFYLMI